MSGWQFAHGQARYIVKAPNAEKAKEFLAKKHPEAAQNDPEPVSAKIIDGMGMKQDGDIAVGGPVRTNAK